MTHAPRDKYAHVRRISLVRVYLLKQMFQAVYERVARGMLHTDRLTFALLLCRIHLKGTGAADTLDQSFGVFLRGKEGFVNHAPPSDHLTTQQHTAAARLSSR